MPLTFFQERLTFFPLYFSLNFLILAILSLTTSAGSFAESPLSETEGFFSSDPGVCVLSSNDPTGGVAVAEGSAVGATSAGVLVALGS